MNHDQFSFPPHKVGLSLEHNEHLNVYQTAAQWITNKEQQHCALPDWKSEEAKQRAIETNEIWTLHWYPETPVAFNYLAAPTLQELLEFAAE